MIVGHQKARDTKQKVYRNFGMPNPEGYRKALRTMKIAEKFGRPDFHLCGHTGRLSRPRRRRAWASRSHRPQLARDGPAAGSDCRHDYGRRRERRRAGDCCRRPRPDDGKFHLRRNLARGLRIDHVEGSRQKRTRGPSHADHRGRFERTRLHRRHRCRTGRRRARRPRSCGFTAGRCFAETSRRVEEDAGKGSARLPLRPSSATWRSFFRATTSGSSTTNSQLSIGYC